MATGNFWYENRCIVVTDEDYELGDVPEIGDGHSSSDRNFGRSYLEDYRGRFLFWDVVITAGYYEGGCIDYVENDLWSEIWDITGNPDKFRTLEEFCRYVKDEIGDLLPYSRIRRHFTGMDRKVDTVRTFVEDKWEGFYELARRAEEKAVNKTLDEIRDLYGYEECRRIGSFSNGETIYEKINQ